MFSPYRALLARPGAKPLLAASGIAWFSYSIYGLGLVLAIEHGTGSFGAAGATIAAFSAGSAALAPVRGRAVDRLGPPVLVPLAVLHAAAVLALLVLAERGMTTTVLALLGAAAGATVPPLIAVARTRWSAIAGKELAPAAHAANAALGEVMQVGGPLAIAAAVLVAPPALPVAALVGGVVAAAVLLAHTGREPEARALLTPASASVAEGASTAARLLPPAGAGFAVIAGGELLLAVAFGALDVALPALAGDRGAPAGAAVPLAVLAGASAAAALLAGTGAIPAPARARFTAGLMLAATGLVAVALAPDAAARALACVPAGAGLGLAFAAVLELLDHVVPAERATEAFTWLTAAGGAGAAAGAALAGILADDPAAALLIAPAAVGAAALAALAGGRHLAAQGPARPIDARGEATGGEPVDQLATR